MRRNWTGFPLLCLLAAACGDQKVSEPPPPAPVLSGFSPSFALVRDTPFVLAVHGEHFTAASLVVWNDVARATRFVSAQRLEVALDTADLNRAQTAVVRITNGPELSAPKDFRVRGLSVKIIGPDRFDLVPGQVLQLASRVVGEDGSELPVDVTWTSSNRHIAVVDSTGLVIALRPGGTSIELATRGYAAKMSVWVEPEPFEPEPGCSGEGTFHTSDITASETWTRAGSPHWLAQTIRVHNPAAGPTTVLTLEPGVRVCSPEASAIELGERSALHARGAAELPIEILTSVRMLPFVPTQSADTSYFMHTRFYGSLIALSGNIVVDSSMFRNNTMLGWRGEPFGVIRNSLLLGDADLAGNNTIENTIIRGGGIYLRSGARARLISTRVESAGTAGLIVENFAGTPAPQAVLLEARGLRIRYSGTYPAVVSAQAAAELLRSQAAQDSILSMPFDTLVVFGSTTDSLVVRRGLPWRVVADERNPALGRRVAAAAVRLEAGSVFEGGIASGRVHAIGTATEPVTFVGGTITVSAPASQLSHFHIRDAAEDGLRITSSIDIGNCKITRSKRDGIRVEGGANVTIRNCDLEDNTSFGIHNATGGTVQAWDTWLHNNTTAAVILSRTRSTPNWPAW